MPHPFATVTCTTRHKTSTRAIVSHLVHEGCWFEVSPTEEKTWDITVKDDGKAAQLFPPTAELRYNKPVAGRKN